MSDEKLKLEAELSEAKRALSKLTVGHVFLTNDEYLKFTKEREMLKAELANCYDIINGKKELGSSRVFIALKAELEQEKWKNNLLCLAIDGAKASLTCPECIRNHGILNKALNDVSMPKL